MLDTIRDLWADDAGSVVAAEYLTVSGVVLTAAGGAAVHVRDGTNRAAAQFGEALVVAVPSPEAVRAAVGPPPSARQHPRPAAAPVVYVVPFAPPAP